MASLHTFLAKVLYHDGVLTKQCCLSVLLNEADMTCRFLADAMCCLNTLLNGVRLLNT